MPSLETPALEKVPASSRPRAAALAPGVRAREKFHHATPARPFFLASFRFDSLPCAPRHAAAPQSPFSLRFLSAQPTVLKVGSTVFVHGGLMPEHLKGGLERLNRDTSTWIVRFEIAITLPQYCIIQTDSMK